MQYTRYRGASYYSSYFPPGVKWLLIVNVAIFLLDYFAQAFFSLHLFRWCALVPITILDGKIWEFVTYMFVHVDLTHILLNMLMLWMFGVDLERDWGTARFLKYYFLCGIAAGVCVFAVKLLLQPQDMIYGTLGASGAIFGLLLAYGILYADRLILMFFLFPMKAKYAVMIFGAVEFLGSFQGGTVSHVAHLDGMLFGYVYLKTGLSRVKVRFSPLASLRRQYHDWKLRRARQKFQVYMKKHDRRPN